MKLAFTSLACSDWAYKQCVEAAQRYGYDELELRPLVKDGQASQGQDAEWKLTLFGEGDVLAQEMMATLYAIGYDGWLAVEWEKWHPELAEPEVLLPLFEQECLASHTAAAYLDMPLIRIVSFFVPPEMLDEVSQEVTERLGALVERAAGEGMRLATHELNLSHPCWYIKSHEASQKMSRF